MATPPQMRKPAITAGGAFGSLISPEEKHRRARESLKNIRKEATYTPRLLAAVTDRITTNSFRRLLSDNAIYTRIANALRDENIPETDRHPSIVDFLALEAIVPVNYSGSYNRPLNSLYERCNTLSWVEGQLLVENHEYFAHELAVARGRVVSLDAITRDLSEDVVTDINTNYWRQEKNHHALVAACFSKMEKQEELTAREVVGVVAIFHGQYPAPLVKHLIYRQNSAYLKFGNLDDAAHAFEHDPAYGEDCRKAQESAHLLPAANSHAREYAEGNDAVQASAWRQKAHELAVEHSKASQLLRIVRTGRIKKREAQLRRP
ncbi:hypothetical protein SODALDRAFT_252865, partial [Sodiomyces alkalinus F11]